MPVSMQRFNPRAREGRDVWCRCRHVGLWVSIHAPVKGATGRTGKGSGATSGFNPRAREGRDATAVGGDATAAAVSIHAPVKGATSRT